MRYICEIFGAPRFSSFSTQSAGESRHVRKVPNSEVAPVFNRLVDRRDKRGQDQALQPRSSARIRHRARCFEKSGIPYGHRPREIDDHPSARRLLLFDDGIPEACRSFDS